MRCHVAHGRLRVGGEGLQLLHAWLGRAPWIGEPTKIRIACACTLPAFGKARQPLTYRACHQTIFARRDRTALLSIHRNNVRSHTVYLLKNVGEAGFCVQRK